MAYGIQIFNANGTSEVFGHNVSNTHLLASGSVVVAANGQSGNISCEGMTTTNTDTIGIGVNSQFYSNVGAVRGTGSFYITNSYSASSITAHYFAYRY